MKVSEFLAELVMMITMINKSSALNCIMGTSTTDCSTFCQGDTSSNGYCYAGTQSIDFSTAIRTGCDCSGSNSVCTSSGPNQAVAGTSCYTDGSGIYYYCCQSTDCNDPNSNTFSCVETTTTSTTTTANPNSANKNSLSSLWLISIALSIFFLLN